MGYEATPSYHPLLFRWKFPHFMKQPAIKGIPNPPDRGLSRYPLYPPIVLLGNNIYVIYPLVNVYITMERSTIFNGKIHYKWPFSIAMLVYQRVLLLKNLGFSRAQWEFWQMMPFVIQHDTTTSHKSDIRCHPHAVLPETHCNLDLDLNRSTREKPVEIATRCQELLPGYRLHETALQSGDQPSDTCQHDLYQRLAPIKISVWWGSASMWGHPVYGLWWRWNPCLTVKRSWCDWGCISKYVLIKSVYLLCLHHGRSLQGFKVFNLGRPTDR